MMTDYAEFPLLPGYAMYLPNIDVHEESPFFGRRSTKMRKFRNDKMAPIAQYKRILKNRKRNRIARKSRRINRRK